MTIAQTSYGKFFVGGSAGSLFDISEFLDIISCTDINAADTTGIPFGSGMAADSTSALPYRFTNEPETDKLVMLPAGAGDLAFPNFEGVALRTQLLENDLEFNTTPNNNIPQNRPINLLHKGRVWVIPEDSPTVNSAVFCRFSAGAGGSVRGTFRTTADTATAAQVVSARWYRGVDVNGLAVLELNS